MSVETTMERRGYTDEEKHRTLKRVVGSSFLGNFIEWFDYASYSYLATVIALVFFPGEDRTVAVMSTFGVFALSFLVRPIGALFWGNMGDKKGRKWALSISILLMSGATFLIGCLPTYAMIGVGAPLLLLLLRMVQSFSAAGEYAGAATFIAEYAPTNHRGFYCSMVPASTAAGLLVGSLFASAMFNIWGADSQFVTEWGWRIPFWLAGPLGYITHYIREHLEDSPVYEQMQNDLKAKGLQGEDKPMRTLFRKHFKRLVISFGACVLNAVGFYAVLTYLPNYLETTLNYDPALASIITNIVLVVYIGFIFLSGRISDRLGRKKMLVAACVGFIILTIPAFMLLSTMNFVVILVVELVMCLLLTINDGTLASYLNETFPTDVRYSGFALSFNLANAIFGGSASYISFWLISVTNNNIAPAFYMVFIAVIAFVAMILSHEHTGQDLTEVE
ncbi:MFS transporter [Gordonibacter sp. An230]|uniref:MFS transporter n=1 Tax=Gordonibacter sp. An230 TaxID=1965592 RepID=UPI000B3A690B|nr:MFS transporter [Gordonibacter sp. An230]OUO88006.1 MFS transporter [Gordonibacter sp. An230]